MAVIQKTAYRQEQVQLSWLPETRRIPIEVSNYLSQKKHVLYAYQPTTILLDFTSLSLCMYRSCSLFKILFDNTISAVRGQ